MFFLKSAKLLRQKEEELTQTQDELFTVRIELQQASDRIASTEGELSMVKDDLKRTKDQNDTLLQRYGSVISIGHLLIERKAEIEEAEQKLAQLNDKYISAKQTYQELESQVALYQDTMDLSTHGLYQPQFAFETPESYRWNIECNYEEQKQIVKGDKAALCKTEWTVGGSKVEGKKMTNQYKRLMLYAFNGECDSLIAKVKWSNAAKTKERIYKAFENINKLGLSHQITITTEFLNLKLKEFALTYEYEQKRYEEKEEQRRIREQMRDEEKAQKEMERAQRDAEDEERRFQKALDKAKQELGGSSFINAEQLNEQIKLLEQKLADAHDKKERAIALAQLTKVGHIYIISNMGSFGEDVYKIGMTRRLDPLDRVKELGDASVPFQFDVHAIIYSENAPKLEYELHQKFKERRLNRVNHKKEFFRVTLDEIENFVNQHANAEIEFTKLAEAREYRETLTMLEQLNLHATAIIEESRFPSSLI